MTFRATASVVATRGDDPTPVKVIKWHYTFDEQLDDATAARLGAEALAGIRALADREGLQIDESKVQISVLPPQKGQEDEWPRTIRSDRCPRETPAGRA